MEGAAVKGFPAKNRSVESRPRRASKELVEEAAPSPPRAVGPDHTPAAEAKTDELSAEAHERESPDRDSSSDKEDLEARHADHHESLGANATDKGTTPPSTLHKSGADQKGQEEEARRPYVQKEAKSRTNNGRYGALCSDEDTDSDSHAGSDVGSEDINSTLPDEKRTPVDNRELE